MATSSPLESLPTPCQRAPGRARLRRSVAEGEVGNPAAVGGAQEGGCSWRVWQRHKTQPVLNAIRIRSFAQQQPLPRKTGPSTFLMTTLKVVIFRARPKTYFPK